MEHQSNKVRKVTSRGTPSYQLGHYEMKGDKGKRRSVFRVDVHLGEHQTPDAALGSWPQEIKELKKTRPKQAEKLQVKLDTLRKVDTRFDTN